MSFRITLSSAVLGSLVGWFGNSYYESWKVHQENDEGLHHLKGIFRKPALPIFKTVSAATLIEKKDLVSMPGEASVGTKRISQIMKYGFPSLDNIRSFEDYVLAYDRRNRVAHWVFEHLTKENCRSNPEVDRGQCEFFPDESIHQYFRSTNEDYFKSGFDRGHLAAAGNHKANQKLCGETFALSNIAPQVGRGFNRDAWNKLEKHVRKLTNHYKNVYVCSGPLYLPRKESDGKSYVRYQVIGKNHVAVPTHFFKIVVAEDDKDELHMESYVMPNEAIPDATPITNFLVPVESIERAAGLLFFDRLSKNRLTMINGKSKM